MEPKARNVCIVRFLNATVRAAQPAPIQRLVERADNSKEERKDE